MPDLEQAIIDQCEQGSGTCASLVALLRRRFSVRDALKLGGDETLVDAAFRDAHRQRVEGFGVVMERHAVHGQEDLRSEEPGSLVAVDGSRRPVPPPNRSSCR